LVHPLISERRILLTASHDINDLIEDLERALGNNPGLDSILDPIREDGARVALRLYKIQKEIEENDID
jgi:hypothetical protein